MTFRKPLVYIQIIFWRFSWLFVVFLTLLPFLSGGGLFTCLLEETGHATSVLSGQPEGVTEFVAFSEFLAKTTGMQSELAERGKTIEDMYHLMAAFGVQARSDDVASVKMLGSQLTALSALVDDVAAGQEERTAHFAESIEA